MNFDMNEVLNNIFSDGIKELDNLFSTAGAKRAEYLKTYSPDVAEKRWNELKAYHQTCKASIIRTGTRKVQEALAPVRDYLDESINEYDSALIFKITELADLADTETEYNAISRFANNGYWALVALNEKAPDRLKNRIARPNIEEYRFLIDQLENRMINTWTNFEGTETALDSIGQIANVDAMNMPMQIQQAIERINSICPAFFTTDMLSAGEALTPAEKERIAQIAEEEFSAPSCDPGNIGCSVCDYIEAHPEDKNMVLRSKYGPIALEYEREYGDARRINKLNRDIHNEAVKSAKKR